MAKNKGFETSKTAKSGWSDEKDEIYDSIPVDAIDYDQLNKDALTTEERLELEAKKLLKHNQQKNMGYIMDIDYYFNVYFICKEDKNEFFEKLGLGDFNEGFIDGYKLAKALGVKIDKKVLHLPKPKSVLI
jgi:ABC-type lipoprotein release transport system permease subunit